VRHLCDHLDIASSPHGTTITATVHKDFSCRRLDGHGLFSWADVIPPPLRRLGNPQDRDWSLPQGAFDQAVRQHLNKFGRT
jgi:hypothetical protein